MNKFFQWFWNFYAHLIESLAERRWNSIHFDDPSLQKFFQDKLQDHLKAKKESRKLEEALRFISTGIKEEQERRRIQDELNKIAYMAEPNYVKSALRHCTYEQQRINRTLAAKQAETDILNFRKRLLEEGKTLFSSIRANAFALYGDHADFQDPAKINERRVIWHDKKLYLVVFLRFCNVEKDTTLLLKNGEVSELSLGITDIIEITTEITQFNDSELELLAELEASTSETFA